MGFGILFWESNPSHRVKQERGAQKRTASPKKTSARLPLNVIANAKKKLELAQKNGEMSRRQTLEFNNQRALASKRQSQNHSKAEELIGRGSKRKNTQS